MTLKPTQDRVVIKPDTENQSSTIIIPHAAQKFGTRGTIVAVGPGFRYPDGKIYGMDLKPGDRVLFSKMHLFPFKENDVEYVLTKEDGVLCKLEADAPNQANGG